MSYEFSQKWYRDKLKGLGSVDYFGPDQPWTAENAGQWITQRTQACATGREVLIGGRNPPSYTTDGKKVQTADCVATGRIKEAARPGTNRVQEWCCPVNRPVETTRKLTQMQAEQYATTCAGRTIKLQGGQTALADLGYWLHKSGNVPSALCLDSGVMEGDYKLLCCKPDMSTTTVTKDGKTYIALVSGGTRVVDPSIEQIAQATAAAEAQAAEREAVLIEAQEPQYSFFQRYGLVLALGAGAIGIGVVAGLLKRRNSTKSEE
jgi:hypothetical protein